jgi:hypothetical protein
MSDSSPKLPASAEALLAMLRARAANSPPPPRQAPAAPPPEAKGELLAAFARNAREELRVTWDTLTGQDGQPRSFLSVRLWAQMHPGSWRPTQKGVTVRARELPELLAVLAGLVTRLEASSPGGLDGTR